MTVDANSTSPARSRAGLALAAIALIVVFGMAGQSVLVRLGASATLVDGCYWALGIAIAAALAVGAGMRPGSSVSPLFGGLAIATDTISAAFFLALAGAIFAWGHDGLAFAIGLGAGCLLLQLVVAPRLAGSGAHSLSGYFAARYPGRVTGALCALTIVVSMLLLLMAELMAAGLVGARLLDIDFATAAAIAACAVLACFVVRGLSGAAWVNGVLFPIMLVAILVPLVVLSARWYDLPVPELAYANALWQVQGLEEKLIEQDLADPAVMRPMLTAFLALTPVNFLGVVLGLAAGVAALPSMLPAQLATVSARHARHAALWGLGSVVLLLTLMPAVAAYAKLSVHPTAGRPHADRRSAGVDLYLRQAGAGRDLRPRSDQCRSGGRCVRGVAGDRPGAAAAGHRAKSRHDHAGAAGHGRARPLRSRAARRGGARRRHRDRQRPARRHRARART